MKNFWDERYNDNEYAYGENANLFFASELKKLSPGKILFPAEGEGRNAVFAAKKGWEVDAFDSSIEGKRKAELLAQKNKVKINYVIKSYQELELDENTYDCVTLVFAHMPEILRKQVHKKLINSLKPGGVIILEAFSKKQIHYRSGGPQQIDMLYSENEILNDFDLLTFKTVFEVEEVLNEGKFHQGKAALIRLVGKK